MPPFFVTATGTDIGKTFVTAALIRHIRAHGRIPAVLKPISSGFDVGNLAATDAGVLLTALGQPLTPENIERISPWRFTAPLSPSMAAARENRPIDFEALIKTCVDTAVDPSTVTLVEGAGGIMTPIAGHHTMLDLAGRLDWPVILVTGSYLGTLSHTLTAREAVTARGLKLAATVVSETPGSTVSLPETAAELARLLAPCPVVALPRMPNDGAIAALAELIGA